jgi:hypothetical protein
MMDIKDNLDPETTFTETKVGSDLLIGEIHRRKKNIDYSETDKKLQELLEENRDSIFVLEDDPSRTNIYKEEEVKGGTMWQSFEFVLNNNLPFLVLDDGRINRYDLWRFAGSDIDETDFAFIQGIWRATFSQKNLPTNTLIEYLYQKEDHESPLTESMKKGSELYLLMTNGQLPKENVNYFVHNFLTTLLTYDSICRERMYQHKIEAVKGNYPSRKFFIQVGLAHIEGIEKTLNKKEGKYRTPLPSSVQIKNKINEYRNLLENEGGNPLRQEY